MMSVDGWEPRSLLALADYINGYAFKPDDWGKEGLPIIRIEQLKNPDGPADYYAGQLPSAVVIDDGDLIFSWSASLFLRIWTHGRAALNQHLFKVIERDGVDRLFLKAFIEFYLPDLTKASHGSTMQHITRKELERFVAPFPTCEHEQSKIAEVLSMIDCAIEQTEALIAKQQRIKTGLMQDLLTRGIDEHGNLRSEQTHEFKDSPLGRIPAEWGTLRLDQMTRPDSPITYGVVQPGRPDDNGVRFVRGGDIYDGIVRMEQLRTISKTISATYKRTVLEGGELVMSLVGYPGEVAVIPSSLAGANIARQAALVRLASVHDARFVMFYLMSIPGKRQVFGSTLGSAQQVVNLKDLRTVVVPRPSPAEEGAIRERVDALYDGIEAQARSLKKLFLLKRGLMHDLLTGNRRVTPLLEQRQRVTI